MRKRSLARSRVIRESVARRVVGQDAVIDDVLVAFWRAGMR